MFGWATSRDTSRTRSHSPAPYYPYVLRSRESLWPGRPIPFLTGSAPDPHTPDTRVEQRPELTPTDPGATAAGGS